MAGISIGPSGVAVDLAPDPAVVVAGLPGLVDHLRRAGSTFGERSRARRLGPLTEADLQEGLYALVREGGADIDADAPQLLAERSGGYPYFLHVYGQQVWNAGTGDLVTLSDARAGVQADQPLVDDSCSHFPGLDRHLQRTHSR